jgi:hypothetical protein
MSRDPHDYRVYAIECPPRGGLRAVGLAAQIGFTVRLGRICPLWIANRKRYAHTEFFRV